MAAGNSKFDIYAALVIITTLFLGGASYFLYDELSSNWAFGTEAKDSKWYITEFRDLDKAPTPYLVVREKDLANWKAIPKEIKGGDDFPVKDFEWPKGYDVYKHPVMPIGDMIEQAQMDALLSTAVKEPVPEKKVEAPVEEKKADVPTEKKPEDKKPEEKKDDAPKAAEPEKKADAAPAEKKADATEAK